ncbi:MAG: YrbL family protein [Gammaproteobacteria bacterium]|nr:methyltransferase domain-containing protein [Pseudomonadales bacterium]MCP5348753.1 methyltransferase domain-containing protein [Pseudomonadales bacterium]
MSNTDQQSGSGHRDQDDNSTPSQESGPATLGAEYQNVKAAFDSTDAASKYAERKNADSPRNLLEQQAIVACIERGCRQAATTCLDIPCGTFRLGKILLDGKLQVTASDYSSGMLEEATKMADSLRSDHGVSFSQQDIMATSFADQSFDLIICNRLFHHYSASDTRVRVLTELRRLCRDTLVISWFDSFSLSNAIRRLKHKIGYKRQRDRYAISRSQFREEARRAGFEVVCQRAIRRFISPQTYAALRPLEGAPDAENSGPARRTPTASDANTMGKVILNDSLLIGTGLHRHCFQDPEHSDRCIKVVFNGNQTETRREQQYYQLLKRRNVPWTCLPDYRGTVATNLGEGAIFDLVRDFDGTVSRSLQEYIDQPDLYSEWSQLDNLLQDLKDYLLHHGIVTMTIKPKNILLQRLQGQPDRLVIIDNIGCSEPFPLISFFKTLARRKTRRRFARFEARLREVLPGRSHHNAWS